MASGKGKTSKNSKKGSKSNFEYVKKIRPKKETVLIELTEEVMCELYKATNTETGLAQEYLGRPIIGTTTKFGKKYIIVKNV